jgi:hypothetical protein
VAAISANQAARFVPALRAGRLCEHGTLGLTVQPAGDDVLVNGLADYSAAERAGVQLGDVVTAVNGRPIRTANEFNNAIAPLPAGWPVALDLRRGVRVVQTWVRLDRLPAVRGLVYLVDRRGNQAEAASLWARAVPRSPASWKSLRCAGEVVWERDSGDQRAGVNVTLAANGSGSAEILAVQPATVRWSRDDSGSPASATAGPAPVADPVVWREWSAILCELLAPRRDPAAWEFVGGDEVRGRVAAVLQPSDSVAPLLRWKFDNASAALLAVAKVTEEDDPFVARTPSGEMVDCAARAVHAQSEAPLPDVAVWLPALEAPLLDGALPRRWRRLSAGGDEIVIELSQATWDLVGATSAANGD